MRSPDRTLGIVAVSGRVVGPVMGRRFSDLARQVGEVAADHWAAHAAIQGFMAGIARVAIANPEASGGWQAAVEVLRARFAVSLVVAPGCPEPDALRGDAGCPIWVDGVAPYKAAALTDPSVHRFGVGPQGIITLTPGMRRALPLPATCLVGAVLLGSRPLRAGSQLPAGSSEADVARALDAGAGWLVTRGAGVGLAWHSEHYWASGRSQSEAADDLTTHDGTTHDGTTHDGTTHDLTAGDETTGEDAGQSAPAQANDAPVAAAIRAAAEPLIFAHMGRGGVEGLSRRLEVAARGALDRLVRAGVIERGYRIECHWEDGEDSAAPDRPVVRLWLRAGPARVREVVIRLQ